MPLNDVISVLYNPEKEKNRRHISKDIRQFTVFVKVLFFFYDYWKNKYEGYRKCQQN